MEAETRPVAAFRGLIFRSNDAMRMTAERTLHADLGLNKRSRSDVIVAPSAQTVLPSISRCEIRQIQYAFQCIKSIHVVLGNSKQ